MKKIMSIVVAVFIACAIVACGSPKDEPSVETETKEAQIQLLEMDKPAETDMVRYELNDVKITYSVGLDSDTWLKPTDSGGKLSAGDNSVFVWISFKGTNISKGDLSGYDFIDSKIDYNDGYIYDHSVFTDGNYKWSTDGAISSNVGLAQLKPLDSHDYYGYFNCSSAILENRDLPLILLVSLPSSNGLVQFAYDLSPEEDVDTSENAKKISDSFHDAIGDLQFVEENAGNVNGNGSRKFADSFVDRLRNDLADLDTDYIAEHFPLTDGLLPEIQGNINTVCDLLVEMGETNSDSNVEQMKQISRDTVQLLEGLLSQEFSAFN